MKKGINITEFECKDGSPEGSAMRWLINNQALGFGSPDDIAFNKEILIERLPGRSTRYSLPNETTKTLLNTLRRLNANESQTQIIREGAGLLFYGLASLENAGKGL